MKSTKPKLANVALFLGSSVFCTTAVRTWLPRLLNPTDYLSQDPVPDKILCAVLAVARQRLRYFGFQKSESPLSVDIVVSRIHIPW